jgi:zinc finger protein
LTEVPTEIRCPECTRKLQVIIRRIEIPYFKEALHTIFSCSGCGYTKGDVMITAQEEPTRYEYKITSPEDMYIRVVRASTCAIKIPELGVHVEPGPYADAYVTNIEGVLLRIEERIRDAINFAEKETQKRRGQRLLARLEKLRRGENSATLVLEDPSGNSAILAMNAKRTRLSEKCASS